MTRSTYTERRYSVCIGINSYDAGAGLGSLQFAEQDAEKFDQLLDKLGFPPANRRLLLGKNATLAAINNALEAYILDQPGPNDLVIFYFAGHSVPITINTDTARSEDEFRTEVCLAPYDFDRQKAKLTSFRRQQALSMDRLRRVFFEGEGSRKRLFILDSCYSGDFYGPRYRSDSSDPVQDHIQYMLNSTSTGRVALSSCLLFQKAMEDSTLGHGRMTYYLLRALRGEEPRAQRSDGYITVNTLFEYLADVLPPDQRPVLSGVQHDSFVLVYYPQSTETPRYEEDTRREAPSTPQPENPSRLLMWGITIIMLLAIGSIALTAFLNSPNGPNGSTNQGTAITSALPATPDATAIASPTPTPLQSFISLPIFVAVTMNGCADVQAFESAAASSVSRVVTGEPAQMRIAIVCSTDEVTITAEFPPQPAYPVELLGDADILTVTTDLFRGDIFIQAAVAYAGGQYSQTILLLDREKAFIHSGDADLLRALALTHEAQWVKAREAYDRAIERLPPNARYQRASAYAGRSLTYILERQTKPDDQAVIDACNLHATSGYTEALIIEQDRGLWRTGRANARRQCPPQDVYDSNAIYSDAKQGLQDSPASRPLERAYALIMLSQALSIVVNKPDETNAGRLAEEASKLVPQLPTPYALLSCLALARDDVVTAQFWYLQFRERYKPKGEQEDLPAQVTVDFCGRY